jgi:Lrp/AsnC family leucine-responsive transcriptional regulator
LELKIERLLDRIGRNIIDELQKNARISFSDIGKKVGLSTPAVAERIRKLEEAGIICGYHAKVRLDKIGLAVTAFIQITTRPEHYSKIKALMNGMAEVLECHHISGEASFIVKVVVPSVAQLEPLVEKFSPFGHTKTTIVLSSPIIRNTVDLNLA